jgi:hypothetical protein
MEKLFDILKHPAATSLWGFKDLNILTEVPLQCSISVAIVIMLERLSKDHIYIKLQP